MTLYSIYAKPEKGPEALLVLPERFIWSAFLFVPLWAILRGTWAYFVLWIVIAGALYWSVPLIGGEAAMALYAVFALWTGFAAPGIAARALQHRDWIASGEFSAPDQVTAERLWLEKTYGARP
ncbi:hypothetical protein [Pelagibacterium sp. H642]|uniref:hypothetical protein n=1 Tax=Pelagibacterium sp. H642 TaxID=1881069 RepID=UPI002816527D|nr:hypothetical protein [Pelagibacterium sp. H642]WMT92258.1 hypothetical protein NO934_08380 [Pelagibacterium sp. H642]